MMNPTFPLFVAASLMLPHLATKHFSAPAPGPYTAGADPILELGLRSTTQGDAQEVVRAMVDALGGEDAIRGHAAITQTGTFEIVGMGISGPIVVRSGAPAQYLMKIDIPGVGLMEIGYDGETGWEDNPMSGKSVLKGSRLDQMRTDANFYGPLGYEAVYTSVQLAGRSEFNGVPTFELRLSFGDGQAARIFVDTTSYLIVGSKTSQQMMGSDIEVTTTYGEYRTFDGLRMSTEWVTDVGGMQQQKTVISDVSFRPHDAGTFDSPEWTEQNPGAGR